SGGAGWGAAADRAACGGAGAGLGFGVAGGGGEGGTANGFRRASISSRLWTSARSRGSSSSGGTVIVAAQWGHIVAVPAFRRAIPSNLLQRSHRNRIGIPGPPSDQREVSSRVTQKYTRRRPRRVPIPSRLIPRPAPGTMSVL